MYSFLNKGDIMKVSFIDCLWCVISVIIIGASYLMGHLNFGILTVYVFMAVVFFMHISDMNKKMTNSVAVFATIKDYEKSRNGKLFTPVVKFTTEEGREITSVYFHSFRKKIFEENSEEMICYDPDNPMFFYFSSRENDMTSDYRKYIIAGAVITAVLFIIFS